MADETKDPMGAEIERLAKEWERHAAEIEYSWGKGTGDTHAEHAAALRAALSSPAPEGTRPPERALRDRIIAHLDAARLTQARLIVEGLWPLSGSASAPGVSAGGEGTKTP